MRLVFLGVCLALCACNADVFTGSDGGDQDGAPGPADAVAESPPLDAPATPMGVLCAGGSVCSGGDICCTDLVWSSAACQASGSAGKTTCLRYLTCSDSAVCGGQVCCANVSVSSATGTSAITTTGCTDACGSGQVQLCSSSAECPKTTPSCLPFGGSPDWVKACQ